MNSHKIETQQEDGEQTYTQCKIKKNNLLIKEENNLSLIQEEFNDDEDDPFNDLKGNKDQEETKSP